MKPIKILLFLYISIIIILVFTCNNLLQEWEKVDYKGCHAYKVNYMDTAIRFIFAIFIATLLTCSLNFSWIFKKIHGNKKY